MRTVITAASQPSRASRLLALGRSVLLASIGALGVTSAALAANAEVTVSVTPIPASVSVQRDGVNFYPAYVVTIQNNTTNVINNVSFAGFTSAPGSSDAHPKAPWVETLPASACTHGENSIQCAIGQLRGAADPAGSIASFVVIFKSPTTGSSVDFEWTSTFSSGNSASAPPANYVTFAGVARTTLATSTDPTITTSFITSVPTTGGTFFTGFNGVPSSTDPGTTKVLVPNRPAGDGTAGVVETLSGDVCAGGFSCVTSTITVPGTFSNLVITLTRDAAYIKPGLKIEKTKIYYTPDGSSFNAETDVIGLCVGFGTPNPLPPEPVLPQTVENVRPCIAFRTQFENNYKPDPELSGDMRWIIYSRHNGVGRF